MIRINESLKRRKYVTWLGKAETPFIHFQVSPTQYRYSELVWGLAR
eukprot:COSAG02_NODE_472_length_21636_cov_767.911366_5_plen_46_part_00